MTPAPESKAAHRKKLADQIATLKKQAGAAKKDAKSAKTAMKLAKEKFKNARRAAKKLRKGVKTLEVELSVFTGKKISRRKSPLKSLKKRPEIAETSFETAPTSAVSESETSGLAT